MKLKEAIKKAVEERNAEMAGKICDILWIRFHMTYNEVYALVNNIAPISPAAWDQLLYVFDTLLSF